MTAIRFYDSAGGIFPGGAQYVVLYSDGAFNQTGKFTSIPNRRYNTVFGGAAAAATSGCADFESGNPELYSGPPLRAWAQQRQEDNHRARVYCNRSDVKRAEAFIRGIPVEWWIATLDNNPHWTPELICESIAAMTRVELNPADIWGIQWGHNNDYDTSYLTGEW